MRSISFQSSWSVKNGNCHDRPDCEPSGSFLATDGIPESFRERLDQEASAKGILDILFDIPNGWAIVYYRADLETLFVGRDIFGRYSLVWTKNSSDGLIIGTSVDTSVQGKWDEVPYGQVTEISVGTLSAKMHCFLSDYPHSTGTQWMEAFTKFDVIENKSKCGLITLSRCSSKSTDYSGELFERLVNISAIFIPPETQEIAVAFSGGVDSLLVTYSLLQTVSSSTRISLVNVVFGTDEDAWYEAPDRKRALEAWPLLKQSDCNNCLRLILVNVTPEKLKSCRKQYIAQAASPATSVLDESLACVLWFALQAEGIEIDTDKITKCSAELFFVGSGADEMFAGYARHRTRFEQDGIDSECEMELRRLGNRNGGRDARVAKQLGRVLVAPFLADDFVKWANSIPMSAKCDLSLPRGLGEKKIIRDCLKNLGAPYEHPKQAMQFGSRMAKMSNSSKLIKV